jgi:putative transposase
MKLLSPPSDLMKRHTTEEILSKLKQAEQLSASGQNQAEICKALNVSVMTFYRWKKLQEHIAATRGHPPQRENSLFAAPAITGFQGSNFDSYAPTPTLSELADENRRLRKIVTDLLLEKIKLEEASLSLTDRTIKQKSGEALHADLISIGRQK